MRIGIDISQICYEGTGVAEYLKSLVKSLLKIDKKNEYVFFFSSLRRSVKDAGLDFNKYGSNFEIKSFKIPPFFLDFLWNKLHIFPIEWFIGDIDLYITSDWTEPPTMRAKKATILYDLVVYKYPNETDEKIVATQKRKLKWARRESDVVFCISNATKKDAMKILEIDEKKLKVIYPGVSI